MVALGEVVRGWTHGTFYKNRPKLGIVLHNTQGNTPVTTYQSAGGWHRLIGRKTAAVYRDVPDEYAAWHVAATGVSTDSRRLTRWKPSWIKQPPDAGVSGANYSALGVELEGLDKAYSDLQYAALRRVIHDWQSRYGAQSLNGYLPIVSHQQLQTDRTDPVRFDYEAFFGKPYAEAFNYTLPQKDPLNGGFLWPLNGVDWRDPLQGGYNFLDWTDSGVTPHPGIDLNALGDCNADAGAMVVSPVKGTVAYAGFDDATTRSVGWHVWIQGWLGEWHHLCHFQDAPTVKAGDQVGVGTQVGRCGRTKGWPCAHVHWEIREVNAKPPEWNFWPYNWSQSQVADVYIDPLTWIVASGATGIEDPVAMQRLNDRELYNVLNNGWNQLAGVPCNQESAHYKAVVRRLRETMECPLPYAAEFDHGLTEAGQKYTSQWWKDGTMSVWVDGMAEAEWEG